METLGNHVGKKLVDALEAQTWRHSNDMAAWTQWETIRSRIRSPIGRRLNSLRLLTFGEMLRGMKS